MSLVHRCGRGESMLKRPHRRITVSSNSSSGSSHDTLSDESGDGSRRNCGVRTPCRADFPIGTILKKYFNGRGWTLGRIVAVLPNGQFEVRFDVEDEFFDESYTYSYSKVARLKKNASVRIGTKLSIYWPHENRYYTAVITKELPRKRENFLVCYCHNTVEREWIDLHRHKYRILVPSSSFNDCLSQMRDSSLTQVSDYSIGTESHYNPTKLPKEVDCVPLNNDARNNSRFNTPMRENYFVSVSDTKEFCLSSKQANKVPVDGPETQSSCEIYEIRQPQHLISLQNNSASESRQISIGAKQEENNCIEFEASINSIHSASATDEKHDTSNNRFETVQQGEKSNTENLVRQNKEENKINDSAQSSMHVWNTVANEITDSPKVMNSAIKRIVTENDEKDRWSPDESIVQHAELKDSTEQVDAELIKHVVRTNVPSDPQLILGTTDSSKVSDNDAESDSIENDNSEVILIDVGTRVEVYWPEDDCYYAGIVTKKRLPKNGKEIKKPFFLIYDDNESEWIDFSRHRFRIIENPRCHNQIKQEVLSSQMDDISNHQTPEEQSLKQQQAVKLESLSLESCSSNEHCNDQALTQIPHASVVMSSCLIDCSKNVSNFGDLSNKMCEKPYVNETETACCINNQVSTLDTDSSGDKLNARLNSESGVKADCPPTLADKAQETSNITIESRPLPDEEGSNKLSQHEDAFSFSGEFIPRRRTSRATHPTKFFANEISEPVLRNGSDHTRASEAPVVHNNTSVCESSLIAVSSTSTLHARTASPTCSDSHREGRKAVLEALVRKKKSVKTEEKRENITDTDNNNPKDDDSISSVKSLKNKVFDDLINLQAGVKVAVWCNHKKEFLDGIIVKECGKKNRFVVKFESANRTDSIDFEKTEFKIIKRKRGRPKKATGNYRLSDEMTSKHEESKLFKEKTSIKKVEKATIEIGTKVAILWDKDGQFHNGTIIRERSKGKRYLVEYDETDVYQWIDFDTKTTKLIDCSASSKKRGRSEIVGEVAKVRIGSHVAVWWEGESKYIGGVVTKIRENARPFYVVYDDGESAHWIDLEQYKFKFLSDEELDSDNDVSESNHSKIPRTDSSKQWVKSRKGGKKVAVTNTCGEKRDSIDKIGKASKETLLSKVVVGTQIEVWWAGDNAFYSATVIDIGSQVGKFFIKYDDDEEEWIDLRKNLFRLPRSNCLDRAHSPIISDAQNSGVVDTEISTETVAAYQESDGVYPDIDNDFVYGKVENVKVGSRIAVWWTMDKVYYAGTVTQIIEGRKPYFIKYDDNDEEWTDLRKRYFRFLDKN